MSEKGRLSPSENTWKIPSHCMYLNITKKQLAYDT